MEGWVDAVYTWTCSCQETAALGHNDQRTDASLQIGRNLLLAIPLTPFTTHKYLQPTLDDVGWP